MANRRRLSAGAFDDSIRVLLIGLFWRLPNAIGRLVGGNIREGLEEIIARERRENVLYVYLSPLATTGQVAQKTTFTDAYWQFYLTKQQRIDLLSRTRPFDPGNAAAIPAGSLILANVGDKATEALVSGGTLKQVKTITELDGTTFFVILQR